MNKDKKRTIMIVDDEYDVVYSLKIVLEETKLFFVDPHFSSNTFDEKYWESEKTRGYYYRL
jgi:hypothetical protein